MEANHSETTAIPLLSPAEFVASIPDGEVDLTPEIVGAVAARKLLFPPVVQLIAENRTSAIEAELAAHNIAPAAVHSVERRSRLSAAQYLRVSVRNELNRRMPKK